MTTETTRQAAADATTDRYDEARFKADTVDHQMTVLHEDGLYRHLRFAKPGTGMYYFDLITWPGYLTIVGDYGPAYVFTRERDMFEFFRAARYGITPDYWSEKLSAGRASAKSYSMERFRQLVAERVNDAIEWTPSFAEPADDQPDLAEAVKQALTEYNDEFEDGAREFLRDFEYHVEGRDPFRFVDTWEWDLSDWDWTFLWACHAIQWGIGQYDAWVADGRPAPEPVAATVVTVELPADVPVGGAS